MSDHFLSRFLNSGRNHLNLSIDDVVILKHKNIKFKEFNLKKSEYNYIRYEIVKNNYVRLISNEKDNELISIIIDEEDVSIKKKQSKKWEVYK